MARLFIFAIGGTGTRVLRSLTMLLASGVKPNSKEEFEIVPIIIDPHRSNDALRRTERSLANYQAIFKEVDHTGFFATRITTLNNLGSTAGRLSGGFTLDLEQVSNTRFQDYIDYNGLDEPNRCLADILFSGRSSNKDNVPVSLLDLEMDIGFIGNPNIGSVVLNQFRDSPEFKEVASNFNHADRIFIVSSIFGGTGAAGFPTILKNIRNAMGNEAVDGKGFLRDARIGAITVLPYFNIEKETTSAVQRSHWIAKTRAALSYYRDNVTGNSSVNALYYIADDHNGRPYKNDPGYGGQPNDAHFVELASALAIIDFLEIPDSSLRSMDGRAAQPVYKEFFTRHDHTDLTFADLEDETERKIALRLSQFALFRKYLDEHLSSAMGKVAWNMEKPAIDGSFKDGIFFRSYIQEFIAEFGDWLKEMGRNKRGFTPFVLDAPMEAFIQGRPAQRRWLGGAIDHHDYDDLLNKASSGTTYTSPGQKLVSVFFKATENLLNTRFGFKN